MILTIGLTILGFGMGVRLGSYLAVKYIARVVGKALYNEPEALRKLQIEFDK